MFHPKTHPDNYFIMQLHLPHYTLKVIPKGRAMLYFHTQQQHFIICLRHLRHTNYILPRYFYSISLVRFIEVDMRCKFQRKVQLKVTFTYCRARCIVVIEICRSLYPWLSCDNGIDTYCLRKNGLFMYFHT